MDFLRSYFFKNEPLISLKKGESNFDEKNVQEMFN